MRKALINHWPFITLILILGFYLGIKAGFENSWDGWRVGSAQVLLSNKHWVQDGFLKNYFLYLPQGYSKAVRYFDDPELRQHARGIATGGFIGRRLYYTHYPSGYLLPTVLLTKLGVEARFWFRFLEILFSLSGLALLYWIFYMIADKIIAFLGMLFYGISTPFLDYADSLANQPLDELLRFGIVLLSIFAFKKAEKHYLKYLVWLLYFALSISSYDSTFFIFAWLIGLDLLIARKIEWKKWLFWASAPVLAFAVQTAQNTWYLGWSDMILDLFGTFKTQILGSRKDFFLTHVKRLIEPFDWFLGTRWYMGIIVSVSGVLGINFIKNHHSKFFHYSNNRSGVIKYLILGLLATLFHFLFYPSLFFYQGRIVSIFSGLLTASLTTETLKGIWQKDLGLKIKSVFLIIFFFALGLWLIQAQRTFAYIKNWPNNIWPAENIAFDKKINNLITHDKVIFEIFETEKEITGPDRYPMVASEDEYYLGAPILGFTRVGDLIRDHTYLKNRSEFPFNAIIISDKKETIEKIKKEFKTQEQILNIENQFILIFK